jgi:hypothetical protein
MASVSDRKPLPEHDVVVHVPKGTAANVRVVESDDGSLPNDITVQISKHRKPGARPVLGVIVK